MRGLAAIRKSIDDGEPTPRVVVFLDADCSDHPERLLEPVEPIPGVNGEPYYDGMEDAKPGSDKAARDCRSALYGSVLTMGIDTHIGLHDQTRAIESLPPPEMREGGEGQTDAA